MKRIVLWFAMALAAATGAGCAMQIEEGEGGEEGGESVSTVEQELPPCYLCDPPPDANLPLGTECGRMGVGGWSCQAPNGDRYYCDNSWECQPADEP